MARRSDALYLALPPRDPRAPVHRWLGTALRGAILEGRYGPARASRAPATSPGSTGSRAAPSWRRSTSFTPKATSRDASDRGPTSAGRCPTICFTWPRSSSAQAPHRAHPPRRPGTRVERGPAVRQRRPGTCARVPGQPAGTRSVPDHAVGPGDGSPVSTGDGRSAARLSGARISAAERGDRRLRQHVARCALLARPGRHCLWGSGGARSRRPPAA